MYFIGGWVDTHHYESSSLNQKVQDMKIDASSARSSSSSNKSPPKTDKAVPDKDDNDDDEEVPVDMEEFEAAGLLDEDDGQTRVISGANAIDPNSSGGGGDHGEILATRTYDMHITYDKFYQTPRLWLFGYDEVSAKITRSNFDIFLKKNVHNVFFFLFRIKKFSQLMKCIKTFLKIMPRKL